MEAGSLFHVLKEASAQISDDSASDLQGWGWGLLYPCMYMSMCIYIYIYIYIMYTYVQNIYIYIYIYMFIAHPEIPILDVFKRSCSESGFLAVRCRFLLSLAQGGPFSEKLPGSWHQR